MTQDKQSLKAQLLAQYAARLDAILEQVEADQPLHLTVIEEMGLKLRREVGQDITAALAVRESDKREVDIACPGCQQVMRYKGRKEKWIKTRTGEIRIERPYYYCEPCQSGYFPPG